jgi:hypothetical protein
MPDSYKHLLLDYNLRFCEDLSASMSKIRVIKQKMINETTANIVISVPNFEPNSFKARRFEIWFED